MKNTIMCIFGALALIIFMMLPALAELIVFGNISAGAWQ